jgi:hypothetical protein
MSRTPPERVSVRSVSASAIARATVSGVAAAAGAAGSTVAESGAGGADSGLDWGGEGLALKKISGQRIAIPWWAWFQF